MIELYFIQDLCNMNLRNDFSSRSTRREAIALISIRGMAFKLLVLKNDWFFKPNSGYPDFEKLTKLINKAYSKARYKFDIITTQRIKDPTTFLEDFSIDNDKRFCFFILLGSESIFDKIRLEDNFERDFSIPNRNLEESYACDIPEKYYDLLGFDNTSEIEIEEVDCNYVLDDNSLKRVLGTAGLKDCSKEEREVNDTSELALTCFTSFMRNTAPQILDTVIYKYLLEPRYMSSHRLLNTATMKVMLYAEVIREHKLVEYYSSKCGFEFSSEILIEVDDNGKLKNNPFEDNILATRNFHVSFIHREIHI